MAVQSEAVAHADLVAGGETDLHSHPGGGGGIPKGVVFPGTPVDGDYFHRTDLNCLFYYDNSRSKWLGSTLEWDGMGRNGNQSTGYLRRFNGQVCDASGIRIPYNITVVGLAWSSNTAAAGNYEVRRNGGATPTVQVSHAADGEDMSLNADFAGSAWMSLYNDGSTVNDPQLRVYWRRHET